MDYLISVVVLLTASSFCSATTKSDKYCEIQEKVCDDDLHPLCHTFRADQLPDDLENVVFYELHATDINFILTNINQMRTTIAKGKMRGYKSAANFRVVKWSADYVRLAEMKLKHVGVCTKITLAGEYVLEMGQFRGEDEKWDRQFYQTVLNARIYNDSYSSSPWKPLFRAEFDTIGCVLYRDVVEESNMFECFTNKLGREGNMYKEGKPCSQCENECSKDWPNLCADTTIASFSLGDYQITVILILSCISVTIVFLTGMVYVVRLIINVTSEDLQKADKTEMASELLYSRGSGPSEDSQINYSHA